MPNSTSNRSQREQQLDAIIAEYYQAVEQGRPWDQADLLRQHPEFSAELLEFFADVGRLQEVAQPFNSNDSGNVANVGRKIRDYRILEKIGAGGMGTVYLALHMRLDKTVALKILKADRERNSHAIVRFEREMKAVGKLEHPHIVRALDAGEEAGTHFLVMEYIEGCDLGRLLQNKGRMEVALACELIRQAALGLQHAHDHSMVHRDIKPSNLMLSAAGQVKVLDLGLAQLQAKMEDSQELTREGQLVGTWLYMAPEHWLHSRQVDSRSDIFSLGVTFYSFLVGKLPLSRGQAATHLPAIGTQRPDVPPDVQMLLSKMLAPTQEQRVQTMAEVSQALQAYSLQGSVNIIASSASKYVAANGLPNSLVGTQVWSSTADEPEVIPPPVQMPPPVQLPPTVTAPAQISPRRYGRHLAAIVAAVAILSLLVVLKLVNSGIVPPEVEREPPLPTPVDGRIIVVREVPAGLKLAGMFAMPKGDEKEPFPLGLGDNQLPPGSYFLISDHPDWLLEPEELVVGLGTSQKVVVKQLPHVAWLFPRLPDQAGAYIEGRGTLWMEGMSDKKGNRFKLPYKLRLTMREKEDVIDNVGKKVTCRWMEVEVTTQGPEGDYTESARLLIDSDEYRRSNSLNVKRGWLTGGSNRIASRLEYLFPKDLSPAAPPIKLGVEFNESNEAIRSRAEELTIKLPSQRISVQHALNLLFGAGFESDSPLVRGVRSRLAQDSKRKGSRELVTDGPNGDLYCWAVKSDNVFKPEQKGAGYAFYRHEAVPFSLVQIDVILENFQAGFKLTAYGPVGTPPTESANPKTNGMEKIEAEVAAFKDLKLPRVRFDEATLPKDEGALARYHVAISRHRLPEQLFTVSLRMADAMKPGEPGRLLEVVVTDGAGFKEEAQLRVVDQRDTGGSFVVQEGWIRSQGEIFLFDPDGDREPFELGLLKLGKQPTASELTIHDVLTLLFGAKLNDKRSGEIGMLRGLVAVKLKQFGQSQACSYEDADGGKPIVLFGKRLLPGEVWTVPKSSEPKSSELPLSYSISRSRKLPFDFSSVVFSMTNIFELTAALESFEHSGARSLLNVDAYGASSLLGTTARRIMEAEKIENWRVWMWDDAGKPRREWAEFRGGLKDGTVLLKSKRDSTIVEVRRVRFQDLSKEDRNWIIAGRIWHGAEAADPRFPLRANFEKKAGQMITLKNQDGKDIFISFEKFSDSEKEWINDLLERRLAEEKRANPATKKAVENTKKLR